MFGGWLTDRCRRRALAALAVGACAVFLPLPGGAQPPARPAAPVATQPAAAEQPHALPPLGVEQLEADVSTRNVEVTSSYTGTEILVFGSVNNSRQPSPGAGYYDIAVVVEGVMLPVITRKKSNVGGAWINTSTVRFASTPSYYAVASTRPIQEIAPESVLQQQGIGFESIRMVPAQGLPSGMTPEDLTGFKEAVVRLKERDGLYVMRGSGAVSFIGKSLFRATVSLPATVPVGSVQVRAFLFRNGTLLASTTSKVSLERTGVERFLYELAFTQPKSYGLLAVVLAALLGLAASALFRRGSA